MRLVIQSNNKSGKSKVWIADYVFSPFPQVISDGLPIPMFVNTSTEDPLKVILKLAGLFEKPQEIKHVTITARGRDRFNKIAYSLYVQSGCTATLQVITEHESGGTTIHRKKSYKRLLGTGDDESTAT